MSGKAAWAHQKKKLSVMSHAKELGATPGSPGSPGSKRKKKNARGKKGGEDGVVKTRFDYQKQIDPQPKTGKMSEAMIKTFPHDVQIGLAERKQRTKQKDKETGLFMEEDWPPLYRECYSDEGSSKIRVRWVDAKESEKRFQYHTGLYSFNTNVRVTIAMTMDNPKIAAKGCVPATKRWFSSTFPCCMRASKTRSEPYLFRKDIRLIEGKFGSTIASYFVFARQLFTLNLVIAIFWGYFVNFQWIQSYSSPTYMADYWPESNLTESGHDDASRAFLGTKSLSFVGLLSGQELEYTMAMFGGYRVPTTNETFRFVVDTGPVLNISGYNMSIGLPENAWEGTGGAYMPSTIEVNNVEAIEDCVQDVYVCKSAVLDVVAAGTNTTDEVAEPVLRSFVGWDATDLWYVVAIIFTYFYSIATIIEAIGDTYEEKYDEEPDDFTYNWGPVVFGSLDFGIQNTTALTFYKDMFNQKLSTQRSISAEKDSFQEMHCIGLSILYLRRLTGLLLSVLLIVTSVVIIGFLTIAGAEFTAQLSEDYPSLAAVSSFAVPVFVAMLNIVTPIICKVLVSLEKWDKETALIQTLWRVFIMKMVNVLVLVYASISATESEGFPEKHCPENYMGKVFWKMVFTDTLVQFIVKITVAGMVNSLKIACTSLSLKKEKELCEKQEKMFRHEEATKKADFLDSAHHRLDKKNKKLDFTTEREAVEANEELSKEDKAVDRKLIDELASEMDEFERQVKQVGARQDFDVAAQIIDLMYKQCLIWCGTVYCPLLPALGTLNMLASFKITRFHVVNFGRNSEKNVGAGNSDRFNLDLLLATVFITFIPCSQFLMTTHQRCGPFTRFEGYRYMVFDFYMAAGFLPVSIKGYLVYVMEPIILLAIFIVLMIVLYFLDKVADKSYRNLDLTLAMLADENKEKKKIIAQNNINLDQAMPEFEGSDDE